MIKAVSPAPTVGSSRRIWPPPSGGRCASTTVPGRCTRPTRPTTGRFRSASSSFPHWTTWKPPSPSAESTPRQSSPVMVGRAWPGSAARGGRHGVVEVPAPRARHRPRVTGGAPRRGVRGRDRLLRQNGFAVLGRYVLPCAVTVPLLGAEVASRNATRPSRQAPLVAIAGLGASVQVLAWLVNAGQSKEDALMWRLVGPGSRKGHTLVGRFGDVIQRPPSWVGIAGILALGGPRGRRAARRGLVCYVAAALAHLPIKALVRRPHPPAGRAAPGASRDLAVPDRSRRRRPRLRRRRRPRAADRVPSPVSRHDGGPLDPRPQARPLCE